MPKIQRAEIYDAKQLSEIAEATFRSTFAESTTAADMDLHCRTSYSETIQRNEICNEEIVTLLSKEGEDIIGFAQMRWNQSPTCIKGHKPGAIQRLYITENWHGKGVAQSLMNACLEEMKSQGSTIVWLGVWEHNKRAIAFYQKFDFKKTGEYVFCVGEDPQRDIILSRLV